MAIDLWGYIHIECDEFPSALIKSDPFKDTGWASYSGVRRSFWMNLGSEPWDGMEQSLQEAQQRGWIERYDIHPYTAAELAHQWR